MLNKKYSHTNSMLGNELYLRKLSIKDLNMLHKNCSSDSEVAKYVQWDVSKSIDDTRKVLQKWIDNYNKDFYYNWGIETINDNELIGTISVFDVDEKKLTCEIGYCTGKKWWSNGYATTCLKYVMNYLFNFVGFNEIICKSQSKNVASIKVIEKCGFHYKTMEKHYIDKTTKKEDFILVYSISKEDFIKFNIEKYLYEYPNFEQCKKFYIDKFRMYNPKIKKINDSVFDIINTSEASDIDIENYCNLLKQRKNELFSLLSESVDFFEQLKKDELTIYLNGSYSRNSQRIYSDIDLNFMYPNKNIKKYISIEDIIAFIVGNTFDIKYRDRIHPMGYLTLINNKQLTKSNYYAVLFEDGNMIISECRNTCYDIMFENINMPRSSRDISNYITSENQIKILKEFVYNHEIVYSNIENKIRNSIRLSDKRIIENKAFGYYMNLLLEKLVDEITYQKEFIKNNVKYVKDFKKKYKTIPSTIIYNVFTYRRRLEMKKYTNLELNLISIDTGFADFSKVGIDEKEILKLKTYYYKYIFELNKIEFVFKKTNISLSSHTDDIIDNVLINFRNIYKYEIYDKITIYLDELYNQLLNILLIMKEEIKDE